MLAARYKLTKDQIIEQIQDEFQDLKTWPPTKDKIEEWVIRWENLRGHIVRAGIMGLFGSDVTYIKEFLKAGRKWAPDFCDSWVREHRAAGREVDFFHTTREYRNEVEMTLKNARNGGHNQANAATLQGKTQDQAESGHSHGSGHCPGHGDEKFKGRKCVCGEVHLFRECPYIVTSARKPGWTENSAVREEIRQKIKKNPRYLTAIRQITDTNILDGLDQKDQKDQTTEDDVHFHFSGVATATKNPLSNSVIYDSGCSQSLTYDKARFVGEIISASDWIDTPNGPMLAEGYGTMRVNGKLGDNKAIKMDFAKTAWVPTTNMTLVSVNKLKKEGYIWDMNQNVLIHQKGKKVCNIEEHYGLPIIEFNPVPIKKTDVVPIQKEDDPAIKTSHTGQIVASGGGDEVPVQANFEKDDSVTVIEKKNPTLNSHASVDSVDSMDSNSDWSKGAPNDLIWMDQWMDQKAHLMETAYGPKKRRFRCKKRCKKRRSKNPKNSNNWAQCGEKVGFQH
jgi:hypothetical protein